MSRIARITGLAYVGIIVTGIFAEFAVRAPLIVDGDPVATATNIAESPGLFRLGVAADVAMITFDVVVAIGLYRLLVHVNRRLAVATTVLRVVQGAVLAVNLVNLLRALDAAREAIAGAGTVLVAPAQDTLDAVERHALGYDTGLIAFGLSCLVLGRLLASAQLVSRPLALGMSATGVVYLTGSFAAWFAPSIGDAIEPFYVIALVTETAFAIRLLVRGLGADASTSRSQIERSPEPIGRVSR